MTGWLNVSTRKVGGLRFIKVGRRTVSFSVSRRYRPLNPPRQQWRAFVPVELVPVQIDMPAPPLRRR